MHLIAPPAKICSKHLFNVTAPYLLILSITRFGDTGDAWQPRLKNTKAKTFKGFPCVLSIWGSGFGAIVGSEPGSELVNKKKYPSVYTTLAIGSVELPNRIVFPSWQVNYANTDGTVSDKLTDLVAMGRAQVADPGIMKKSLERREGDEGHAQNATSVCSGRLAIPRCTVVSIRN